MTKANCLMLLKRFKDIGRTEAYEDMKQHILNGRKFSPEEKAELFPEPKPVEVKLTKSKGKK